jgi:hypothetical protein
VVLFGEGASSTGTRVDSGSYVLTARYDSVNDRFSDHERRGDDE